MSARDFRFVRYGQKGRQLAIVRRVTAGGRWIVQKYQHNSDTWTRDVSIVAGLVLEPATLDDVERITGTRWPEPDKKRKQSHAQAVAQFRAAIKEGC